MIYLLKAHICLSIFLMIYWGFLRKNTFYQVNRIYFLLAMIASLTLPLLNVSDFVNQHQEISRGVVVQYIPDLSFKADNQIVMSNKTVHQNTINSPIFLNYLDILQAIFLSGIVVLLCKLIVQIISILRFVKTSKPLTINQVTIRNLSRDISPFSFFNYIFINTDKHSEEDLSEILAHEYVHVRQIHSLDVILAELFCIIFWINPLAWVLRKFLKQNLEFLTDQTVLNQGFDSRHYQYNLLKISGLSPVMISNNFNFSDLKLRIKMMNRKRSSKLHLVKYFVIIPLGAVLILVFNISKAKPFDVKKSVVENVREMVKAVEFESEFIDEHLKFIVPDQHSQNENITIAYPDKDILRDNQQVVKQAAFQQQTTLLTIMVVDEKTRTGVEGVEINIVGSEEKFKTNFQGICLLDISLNYSKRDTCNFLVSEVNIKKGNISTVFFIKQTPQTFKVILTDNDFKEIAFNRIVHNTIAYDRKGNLFITPKTKWFYCKEDIIKELNRTQELELSKRPLYKINGTIVAQNYNWNAVEIKSILNLDYWSPEDGEKLVPQFGELARNGIYNLNVLEKTVLPKREYKDVEYPISNAPLPKTEKCTPSADFPTNAIYVIDGKVADSGYLHKNVPVENIEKLEVMDAELAKIKYGDKGKKGVILISTKKINKLEEK